MYGIIETVELGDDYMKKIKGNLLYGQSGGPTSVINSSAYGIITEALKHQDVIDDVLIMRHGIQGALNEDFYYSSKQDPEEIELLKHTPGSAFGSVRYKMPELNEDETMPIGGEISMNLSTGVKMIRM